MNFYLFSSLINLSLFTFISNDAQIMNYNTSKFLCGRQLKSSDAQNVKIKYFPV